MDRVSPVITTEYDLLLLSNVPSSTCMSSSKLMTDGPLLKVSLSQL